MSWPLASGLSGSLISGGISVSGALCYTALTV
jgi:hypothetical protein